MESLSADMSKFRSFSTARKKEPWKKNEKEADTYTEIKAIPLNKYTPTQANQNTHTLKSYL